MTPPAPRRVWSDRVTSRISLALLVAAALVPYVASLGFHFVAWDDPENVFVNPAYNPPAAGKIAALWNVRKPYFNLYVPVTYTCWGVISEIATGPERHSVDGIFPATRLEPGWFHAANLLAHAAASIALWLILVRLNFAPLPAAGGAIFFAVHPMQAESVAWVSGFRDILAGALALVALWQLLCAVQRRDEDDDALESSTPAFHLERTPAAMATVCFALALLAKPTAVLLPISAVGLLWFVNPRALRPAVRLIIGWMCLAIVVVGISRFAQPAQPGVSVPSWFRPVVALDALAFYVRQMVVDWNPRFDYGRTPMSLYDDFRRAWPILLLIPVALAAWRRRWRRSSITSALLFVPPLVPVLGFASFDFQYFSTVADHYVYLAMAGPAFLIATLAARAPRLGRIAIACVLVLLTIRSAYVASAWADTTSLCNQALGADPGNTAANLLLGDRDAKLSRDESASGDANSARQHFDSAMKHFQTILSNRPDDGVVLRDMGSLQLQFGQLEPAAQALARSVHERPDDPDAHQNLAAALDQLGLVKEAAAQFATAVSIKPDDAEIRANYGNFLTRHGSFDAAIPELQAALAIDPTNAVAQRDMRYIRQTETPATTPSIGKP